MAGCDSIEIRYPHLQKAYYDPIVLWYFHTIYHDSCVGCPPGCGDEPFLGVLIVKRPRGDDSKSSHESSSQSNPKSEVNVLVDVSDDRRADLNNDDELLVSR